MPGAKVAIQNDAIDAVVAIATAQLERPPFWQPTRVRGILSFPRRNPALVLRQCRKNLFCCHGESLAYLKQHMAAAPESELRDKAAFYHLQFHRYPEAVEYLQQRGPVLIEQLGVGYAPGGYLRRHLVDLGYSLDLLLRT